MQLNRTLAAGLLGLAACGGTVTPPGVTSPSLGAGAFRREITPLPVFDSAGVPYDHPFLGGFNVPRPQLVDIDADGDLDLFVQEAPNQVMFFERVDSRWVWRTDRFQDLDIGEWIRFADLDRDGDLDILAELRNSYVRFYRNDGGPASPRYVSIGDSVRATDGTPVFSDRQNIPQLGDIDCDSVPDLLIGRVTGTVARHEMSGMTATGPRFTLLDERFEGIEIIGELSGSLHGANTMAVADVDGDGDPDLIWGDFFEAGLLLIENTGSCLEPSFRNRPVPFPRTAPVRTSGYNAPTFGDVDGDNLPDMVMGVLGGAFNPNRTSVDNLHFARGTGDGGFRFTTTRLIRMLDVGSDAQPMLADLDGDGDLDLLVGGKIDPWDHNSSVIHVFENVMQGTTRALVERPALAIRGEYHYAPAGGDVNGDGFPDLVLGAWGNRVRWYQGGGTLSGWTLADSALVTITRGSNTTPALGDLDGDGDLDLVVGEASGALNYYRNDGLAGAPPVFTLVSDTWLDLDVGRRSAPALVDLDGDGDLDLVVGSEDGTLVLLRNTGSRTEAQFASAAPLPVASQPLSAPAFGDLDGDGRLQLLLGTAAGGLLFFRVR